MPDTIVVLNADETECAELCAILEKEKYLPTPAHHLDKLDGLLNKEEYLAVILDIDSIPVDNRTVRELTLKYPEVCFLCTSKDQFHPELKDAICYHIYACINKPVDPDELIYFLRSIKTHEADAQEPAID